jgi:hypothetical protein
MPLFVRQLMCVGSIAFVIMLCLLSSGVAVLLDGPEFPADLASGKAISDTAAALAYTGDGIKPPHASMILVPLWVVGAAMTIGIFARAFPRR